MSKPKIKHDPLTHSWALKDWPPQVFPGNSSRGRRIVRKHFRKLREFGAFSRVDRDLIILGQGFAAFLMSGIENVEGYEGTRKATAAQRQPTEMAAP